jgi:hypothetical protein
MWARANLSFIRNEVACDGTISLLRRAAHLEKLALPYLISWLEWLGISK